MSQTERLEKDPVFDSPYHNSMTALNTEVMIAVETTEDFPPARQALSEFFQDEWVNEILGQADEEDVPHLILQASRYLIKSLKSHRLVPIIGIESHTDISLAEDEPFDPDAVNRGPRYSAEEDSLTSARLELSGLGYYLPIVELLPELEKQIVTEAFGDQLT